MPTLYSNQAPQIRKPSLHYKRVSCIMPFLACDGRGGFRIRPKNQVPLGVA